jgi:hypothetical protein
MTAKRYVRLAKSLCPSLQYAQVSGKAWQITVARGAVLDTQEAIDNRVHLRRMDDQERMAIELFAMAGFANESGLVGDDIRRLPDFLETPGGS